MKYIDDRDLYKIDVDSDDQHLVFIKCGDCNISTNYFYLYKCSNCKLLFCKNCCKQFKYNKHDYFCNDCYYEELYKGVNNEKV